MTDPHDLDVDRDLDRAHDHTADHREEVLGSELCGCGYCLATFGPAEIVEWTDDDQTALCPACGFDIVLGSASGWPITAEFLGRIRQKWFGP